MYSCVSKLVFDPTLTWLDDNEWLVTQISFIAVLRNT